MKERVKMSLEKKVKTKGRKTHCVFGKEPTVPLMKGREKSEIKVQNDIKLSKNFGKIIKNVLNKKDKV